MTKLHCLWRGELELADAFWNWAVFGGLLVNMTSSMLFLVLMMFGQPVLAFFAGYGPSIPYNVIVCVGVWRSAGNHRGEPRWAHLARAVTVAGMILLTLT